MSVGVGLLLYALVLLGCLAQKSLQGSVSRYQHSVGQPVLGSASIHSVHDGHEAADSRELTVRHWITLPPEVDYELIDLDGHGTDVILITDQGNETILQRLDGRPTGMSDSQELWSHVFPSTIGPSSASIEPTHIWGRRPTARFSVGRDQRPQLIRPAPDLDGDGTADLVWHSANRASGFLNAVSGATGKRLWLVKGPASRGSRIVSAPLVVDIDDDQRPDLIACFQDLDGSVWMEGILGSDGQRAWSQPLSKVVGQQVGMGKEYETANEPRVISVSVVDGQNWIVVEDATKIRFHSVQTGLPSQASISPTGRRAQSARFRDLDGDGESETISFRRHGTEDLVAGLPLYGFSVWDHPGSDPLWCGQFNLGGLRSGQPTSRVPLTIVDVDDDGRMELVQIRFRRSTSSLNLVDAMTGKSIWPQSHQLSLNPRTTFREILEHSDVDGDGIQEVLVVSLDQAKRDRPQLATYIDLLSGQTGCHLASMRRPLAEFGGRSLISAEWLQNANRHPYLIVGTSQATTGDSKLINNELSVEVWAPRRCELIGSIENVSRYQLCDFDGGGRTNLCVARTGFDSTTLCLVDINAVESSSSIAASNRSHRSSFSSLYVEHPTSTSFQPGNDPRWLKPLPWVNVLEEATRRVREDAAQPIRFRIEYLGLAQLAFLGIFLAPGWLIFSSVSRGQWSLGKWLLLPAAIGVAITTTSFFAAIGQTEEIARFNQLPITLVAFLIPLFSGSLLLLPMEVGILLLRRHFRSVGVLLGVVTILAIGTASVWIVGAKLGMHPNVSFSWDGWYWIWLFAAYITGWAYLFSIPVHYWTYRLETRQRFVCHK